MNKSAIQKFAMWARTTLMEQVAQRAYQYGITKDGYGEENAVTVNGMALSPQEQSQRRELVREIQAKGYDQVVEEVAYTWFNRFIALRYMEVNNYLPSHIRVFSNAQGAFDPEILKEALHIDLPGLDQGRVAEYIEKNETEALYRYLLLTQCNALNEGLPGMFEKMGGYTELLFPNNILRPDSVPGRMVADIPEEDWTDQVQIIGWLYQYYNSEKKAQVFARPSGEKIKKENIPAATQLFTPDWIVRYMVENSLGRLWIDHLEGDQSMWHPDDGKVHSVDEHDPQIKTFKAAWRYYLDEAEQPEELEEALWILKSSYAELKPEDITLIDPCMGSGHILVYAFDVLMQIYESQGWSQRDAAASIVERNLYGLDIDQRAAQLAYFAVMMKARQYDRRFLTRGIRPQVYAVEESNSIRRDHLKYFGGVLSELERNSAQVQMEGLLDALRDGKNLGSLLTVDSMDWDLLRRFVDSEAPEEQLSFDAVGLEGTQARLRQLIDVGEVLSQQYDVTVTNPPYMAVSNGNAALNQFVKEHYPDSKGDLFACFMERCGRFTKENCFQAMITQHAWMFLSSYEKLRVKLLQSADIMNMAHLGPRAFEEIGGEVVQTTSFVLRRGHIPGYQGTYCRLIEPTTQQGKEDMFLAGENRYTAQQENFEKIPGAPVAYWVSKSFSDNFQKPNIGNTAEVITGMTIGDNNLYLRLWYEVAYSKAIFNATNMEAVDILKTNWIPYSKGGPRRNWYGNYEHLVNWSKKDRFNRSKTTLQHLYLKDGITWPFVTSGGFSARLLPAGFLWDVAGSPCFFRNENTKLYVLGALCSNSVNYILRVVNPTINVQAVDISRLPLPDIDEEGKGIVISLVKRNINISRRDWDSFENSWDFKRHPLV